MGKELNVLEKVSIAVSCGILLGALYFWVIQVRSVIELLRLAYS